MKDRLNYLTVLLVLAAVSGCGQNTECNLAEGDTFYRIASAGLPANASFAQTVDYFRHYVNTNSKHEGTEEFSGTCESIQAVSDHIIHGAPAPVIFCGARAEVMLFLLEKAGIEGRRIEIYSSDFDTLQGHTLAEVKNPSTGSWRVADPDFDVYWTDGTHRLSELDLITKDYGDYEPCAVSGCGWTVENHDGYSPEILRDGKYHSALMYYGTDWGQAIINTDRYDLAKRFPERGNRTLLEVLQEDGRSVSFSFVTDSRSQPRSYWNRVAPWARWASWFVRRRPVSRFYAPWIRRSRLTNEEHLARNAGNPKVFF